MTQVEFARSIDVSLDTVRNWEQGRRGPSGAARTLLRVLDAEPEAGSEGATARQNRRRHWREAYESGGSALGSALSGVDIGTGGQSRDLSLNKGLAIGVQA